MSNIPQVFVIGSFVRVDETRLLELKEVKGPNAIRAIVDVADEYAVAFLNSEGGRILWGIRDADKMVLGVELTAVDRDRLRRGITGKLGEIQPQLDPSRFKLNIHPVINGGPNLAVVELEVPAGDSDKPFFTGSHECFVRVDAVTKKLSGQQLTDWILSRSKRIHSDDSMDPALGELAQRVKRIFTGHGLLPSHLARFFALRKAPFTITMAELQNDATFLRWLDEEKISWIAQTFGVRRAWIDGEDGRIFTEFRYDKRPQAFLQEISHHTDALIYEDTPASPDATFVRFGQDKDWGNRGRHDVFVIIRVPLARLSDELTVYRYISDFEPYDWVEGRTAVQLRAWARLLVAEKDMYCRTCEVSTELGEQIWSNGVFLHEILASYTLALRTRDDWHPEDYALYPEESIAAKPDVFFPHVIQFLKANDLPYQPTQRFGKSRSQ